ncbi:phytase [Paucibacter sp. Y2R2-4]|uniref:phytase n=1 Tax=Paucibacter sp. Y2R2-4 TaxID=2893553 RepID=UPI0021E3CC9F|nr:phytase [Paucibacter sp. Y2R2-4]MCV2351198.1 phytase [Paucibacter sp. Y2R2-4]
MSSTPRLRAIALCIALLAAALQAQAASAVIETPTIDSSGDADDPAIWLNPLDASKSLVITSVKNSGLRVYDLNGQQLQSLLPPGKIDGVASRLNNVDVQYNFRMADGSRADLAIYSDRGQDTLRAFKINASGTPLTEVTGYNRLFPQQPLANQATGYGLALWRDQASDKLYSLVAQRGGSGAGGAIKGHSVAQFEMIATPDGKVSSQQVRSWDLPTSYKGQSLLNGIDSTGSSYSPQSEGMVVDQQTGMLYVGQEDVGIWGIDLASGTLGAKPLIETKNFDPNSPLTPDVEGLTIRYAKNGEGVILASSQGDSSFAAFNRKGFGYLGSFSVGAGAHDAVEHSDGADVSSFALPGFEDGVFITQDGENVNNGALVGTNFKYVKWSDLAKEHAFLAPYAQIDPDFDPRNVAAIPEPSSYAMLISGLAALALLARRRKV